MGLSGSQAVLVESQITYLCGNSLGLLSQRSNALIQEELSAWAKWYGYLKISYPRL
jgi:kynureninase